VSERKPKYAVNLNTGEVHKLKAVTGACHLPEDAKLFLNLTQVKRAKYADRCGHCFGIGKK
jgi:hypothetical protein